MDISIVKALPDDVMKGLCNTLIHSLWQGLVLAALAGLVIIFTRRATSAMRYNLLVTLLVLFTFSTVYTFVSQLHAAQFNVVVDPKIQTTVAQSPVIPINNETLNNQRPSLTDNLIGYFNTHANLIVMIWLLVVCARSIQLATGLNSLYHLKRRYVFEVDAAWQNRVYELSAKLGIPRMVKIAESGIAKVPMVIGHLKPIILIPVGLITALSPAEIDAILVHELAHIRRRDYLVNLLQSFMEIVFFFNPAVLWISTLIKTERENCCDDIAIAQTSNKASYIRALVWCQEYQLSAPAYAMALGGGKNHLLGRVKRMVSNNNQSLNLTEKSLLAACLLIACLLTTAFTNADKINKLITDTTKTVARVVKKEIHTEKQEKTEFKEIKDDTIPVDETNPEVDVHTDTSTVKVKIYQPGDMGDKTSVQVLNNGLISYLSQQADGTLYQFNFDEGVLRSVQVNGKTLSGDELAARRPAINKIIAQQDEKFNHQRQKLSPATLGALNGHLSKLDTNRNYNYNQQQYHDVKVIADSVNRTYKAANEAYKKNYITVSPPATPVAPVTQSSVRKTYNGKADDPDRDLMISQMVKDGIIAKRDESLSFKLSTAEFIVNGKKQPDDVYQKYRAAYVKATGHNEWAWYYNYDTSTEKKTERTSITTY